MVDDHLVGGWALALWKMMEWVTVGMMTFSILMESHLPAMFQTTNQIMDYPIPKLFGSVNRFFCFFFNIDD